MFSKIWYWKNECFILHTSIRILIFIVFLNTLLPKINTYLYIYIYSWCLILLLYVCDCVRLVKNTSLTLQLTKVLFLFSVLSIKDSLVLGCHFTYFKNIPSLTIFLGDNPKQIPAAKRECLDEEIIRKDMNLQWGDSHLHLRKHYVAFN